MNAIGANIKARREVAGLSGCQLSEMAGITRSWLYEMENNPKRAPSAAILYRIAAALECSMETLMNVPELPRGAGDVTQSTVAQDLLILRRRLARIAQIARGADNEQAAEQKP